MLEKKSLLYLNYVLIGIELRIYIFFSIIDLMQAPYPIINTLYIVIHCKNSFGIISNYLSLLRSHHTVRNKDNLDSFLKTKTSILAL